MIYNMAYKHFLIIIFFFNSLFVFSQEFQFTAKSSKTTLGVNQRLKIEFSVNKNGADDFRAPDFRGFKVVAGPSTSVSQSWVNGVSSYSMSYVYFLEPTTKGEFTIPGATITYQGREYKSNAINIQVTNKVEDPSDPQIALSNSAKENIFLATHLSKENPFVGESIYVEYRLYFTNNIEFNNPQFGEMPKYEGFWNQEIPITNFEKQVGEYQGKKYNYFTLKKAVLIPQKSGVLTIGSIDMDVVVGVPTGRYDFFGYPLIQRLNEHYTSGSRRLSVKPLPETGKPEDFTGAVGDFKFEVISNKNTLGANESARIDVTIKGVGNLKLFELPKLKVPSELEVYSPQRTEKLNTTLSGLNGSVTDSYNIVANNKGKYPIPGISFSYFNPKSGKYHTINSAEIVIEATHGNDVNNTAVVANKKNVVSQVSEFKYIANKSKFKKIEESNFYGSATHYTLMALPFVLLPLFLLVIKKRNQRAADVLGNKLREAKRLTKKYLSEAHKKIGDKNLFYEALEKALHNFLKAKLNIETSDISQEKIAQLLKEQGVSDSSIQQLIDLLNDCNFARYTPMVKSAMETELDKAAKVIQKINTELK